MKKIIIVFSLLITLLVTGCATNKEEDKKVEIQFYRNATMKVTYGGKTFLTDPMFAEKESMPGFLYSDQMMNPSSPLPVAIEEIMSNVEAILVSHTHIPAEDVPAGPSDHFDQVAIDTLAKDLPIYVQDYDKAGLNRVGFTNVTSIENSHAIDNITLTRFDGLHTDFEPALPLVGESSGYVFKAEGYPTILWTGDTLLTDEVLDTIKSYQPDIIIAHTGGAQLPLDDQGNVMKLVMDADDAIKIAKAVPNAKLIAIHMEALDHCPVTRNQLREKANEAGISKERLIIPADGETINF